MSPGTLYVVATPIGNLEDITFRAINTLKEVDLILCEDKRVTSKLLNKYRIQTKLVSFHKYNENKLIKNIIPELTKGKKIALVSDAGTPLISDPGSSLISCLRKNDIKVIVVPGPSSLTAALSISGFKIDQFLYVGFLPDERSKRISILSSLVNKKVNFVVLFIAPHDLKKYLLEISDIYPDINGFFARELTKIFEESWYGRIVDLIKISEMKKIKGEIVLILDLSSHNKLEKEKVISDNDLLRAIETHLSQGFSIKEASMYFGKLYNIPSKNLYSLYIKNKN